MNANSIIRLASTLVIAFGALPAVCSADETPTATTPPASAAATNSATATESSPVKPAAVGTVTETAPECSCMASDPNPEKKHKGGPVRHMLKGLSKEFGSDMSDMGKDAMFVFSAQDFDPYASKPGRNPKRPYVVGDAEYVDGTSSQIVKFPDRSMRIYGGFADGTYCCPISTESSNFVVYYPNGVRGELTLSPNGTAVIKRPDNTTTRITKTSGGYKITNDKLGYMGEINPDTTGLNYEFARSSNPAKILQSNF